MTPEIQKVDASDAGCWIDGHWGRYGSTRLIEIAGSLGWPDTSDPDLIKAIACHDSSDNDCGVEDCSCAEITSDASDEAEAWMNENCAPDGYFWGWYDGEFYLWSDESWEAS